MSQKDNPVKENAPEASALPAELAAVLDGKYELLEEIGRGASGIVYKGRHLVLDQLVAIKIVDLRNEKSNVSLKRFQNEAQVLSSISHPSIVKFIAFGSTPDGRYYTVLEYLDGETLESRLKRESTIDQDSAVAIFLDIAQALACAHEHGVVHRDVKPANVFLSPGDKGRLCAKLLDFGIFKHEAANQGLTRTGAVLGSVNYMSPEQCKQLSIDKRSDLYSLGCLMYETLVGTPPMQAETDYLVMSNHLSKETISVPSMKAITLKMESIILRCLKKDPKERFQSAAEVIQALQECSDAPLKSKHLPLSSSKVILLFIGALFVIVPCLVVAFGNKKESIRRLQNEIPLSNNLRKLGKEVTRPPDQIDPPCVGEANLSTWLSQAVERKSISTNELVDAAWRLFNCRQKLLREGKVPAADKLQDRLVKVCKKEKGAQSPTEAAKRSHLMHLCGLAIIYCINDDDESARRTWKEALSLADPASTSITEAICAEARDFGTVLVIKANFEAAKLVYADVLKVVSPLHQPDLLLAQAKVYGQLGQRRKQKQQVESSADEIEKLFSRGLIPSVGDISNCAMQLLSFRSPDKGIALLKRYLKASEQFGMELISPSNIPYIKSSDRSKFEAERKHLNSLLVRLLILKKNYADAEKLLNEIHSWKPKNWQKDVQDDVFAMERLTLSRAQGKALDESVWSYLEAVKENCGAQIYMQSLSTLSTAFKIGEKERQTCNKKIEEAIAEYSSKFPFESVRLHWTLADCLVAESKLEDAENEYKAVLTALKRLEDSPVNHDLALYACSGLMTCAGNLKHRDDLEKAFSESRNWEGTNPDLDYTVSISYMYHLGILDQNAGIAFGEPLIKRFENRPVNHLSSYHSSIINLSVLYLYRKDYDKSIALLKQGLAQTQRYRAEHREELHSLLSQMALVYSRKGDKEEASRVLQEAKDLRLDISNYGSD